MSLTEKPGRHPAVLIIGIGNDWRGDDAAGLVVARQLQEQRLPHTCVLTEQREGMAILAAWEEAGAEQVILVDALASGAEPGTILRLNLAEELPPVSQTTSTHSLGVIEAVELGRILGSQPLHLILYGIEGAVFTLGSSLSPQVECAVDRVIRMISKEVAHVSSHSL